MVPSMETTTKHLPTDLLIPVILEKMVAARLGAIKFYPGPIVPLTGSWVRTLCRTKIRI
jgi:hypothetical protein